MRRCLRTGTLRWALFLIFILWGAVIGSGSAGAESAVRAWVDHYGGSGDGENIIKDVLTDSSGNIYVTGKIWNGISMDVVTIKYDPNGNPIGVAQYDSGSYDAPSAFVTDASGNIYVTGESYDGDYDFITIKYDPNGNQLWAARYESGGDDHGIRITVDPSGNVYVTGLGSIPSGGTDLDFVTVKYDADGNEIWAARYDGGEDNTPSLSLDASGNVYVSGTSSATNDPNNPNYTTIKYDSFGNQVWLRQYDNGGSFDASFGMSVDSSGNVIVTGLSEPEIATVKYASNGDVIWVERYGTSGDSWRAFDLVIDPSGHIYVTGRVENGTTADSNYALVKYDSNGTRLWVAQYDSGNSDSAYDIILDAFGNIYLNGTSVGVGDYDLTTVKFDTDGNQVWAAQYNSGHDDLTDLLDSLAIDSAGHVYVTGFSFNGTAYDFTLMKYIQVPSNPTDTIPPVLSLPSNIVVNATSPSGAVVTYSATATDDQDPNPTFYCSPHSGDLFPIGFNTVTCTATDASGNSASGSFQVTVVSPPTVTTNSASSIASSSATLRGSINPKGGATNSWFEWGLTTAYDNTTALQPLGSGNTAVSINQMITGLAPNTTYHFRAVGENSAGITYGTDRTFNTLANPPIVVTEPATDIDETLATLNGTANPNGVSGSARFQYGTSTAYESTSASRSISGSTENSVSVPITGLVPGVLYHFRIMAQNNGGTTFGADETFTTLGTPPSPDVTTAAVTNIEIASAILTGIVNTNGVPSTAWFEWGSTPSYGTRPRLGRSATLRFLLW